MLVLGRTLWEGILHGGSRCARHGHGHPPSERPCAPRTAGLLTRVRSRSGLQVAKLLLGRLRSTRLALRQGGLVAAADCGDGLALSCARLARAAARLGSLPVTQDVVPVH